MSNSRRRVGAVLALVLLLTVMLVPAASAAPAPSAASTAWNGGGTWYVVRFGDTLYKISARFGVSPSAIAQANHISNWDRIYAGQRLWIPSNNWGPCGWNPCPPPKPQPGPCGWNPCPPPPPPPQPGPCGWNPCPPPPPPPQPGPCGWNPCPPQPGPCGWNPCPPPPGPGPCGWKACLPPLQSNWNGQYYNDSSSNPGGLSGNVVLSQNYGALDFNWNGGSPGPNVNSTYWSARYTTTIWLQGGTYRTQAAVDDGVRVFIDGTQVINGWVTQPVTVYSQDVWVGQGNHNITVEYYQATGFSELHFAMVRIGN